MFTEVFCKGLYITELSKVSKNLREKAENRELSVEEFLAYEAATPNLIDIHFGGDMSEAMIELIDYQDPLYKYMRELWFSNDVASDEAMSSLNNLISKSDSQLFKSLYQDALVARAADEISSIEGTFKYQKGFGYVITVTQGTKGKPIAFKVVVDGNNEFFSSIEKHDKCRDAIDDYISQNI